MADLIGTKEAARLLQVHRATVNRWLNNEAKKKELFPRAYQLDPSNPKSDWRIPMADIEEILRKRREQ